MRVLGIETSCDETAVCLVQASGAFGPSFKYSVLGNALVSQIAIHAEYGGVFPNLAKREHAKNLVPLLEQVLPKTSGKTTYEKNALQTLLEREPELFDTLGVYLDANGAPNVDAIAVTHGPGLEPALWVGVNFAKALSSVWNVPIVPVNHLEGHVAMALMDERHPVSCMKSVEFPAIALLISGGHTELDLVETWPEFRLLGETRDDAVGEAFDKVARMMGIAYPGGPEIARLAAIARSRDLPKCFTLPRPMLHEKNFDFSFSGLKTAVLRQVKDRELSAEEKMAMAHEFEDAATEVLVKKTLRAVDEHGARSVIIGGGVSANIHIRTRLSSALESVGCTLLSPPPEWATDNAVMIALAGYFHAIKNKFVDPSNLRANGNLRLGQPI